MKEFQGVLLDLDDTLYDYSKAHQPALESMLLDISTFLHIPMNVLLPSYHEARKRVHNTLEGTASSHNRLLYIQKTLEIVAPSSVFTALQFYDTYWDTFLENLCLYEGALSFLENLSIPVCLVTDLTAHIQHRKIKKLGIEKYIHFLTTSEEIGREKPHPFVFMTSLEKMQLAKENVCMIGDNFQKDILGASSFGIQSFWFNPRNQQQEWNSKFIREFKHFEQLKEWF